MLTKMGIFSNSLLLLSIDKHADLNFNAEIEIFDKVVKSVS